MKKYNYTVLVRCYTYNQEKYIEDALKGFVSQITNFPFLIVIVDDASTDNTAEIIRKYSEQYPELIKFIALKENHYSKKKGKIQYIQEWRNQSKYEAVCEGDDYWTDPYKLQKQVDILEQNPDVGLVHTDFDLVEGKRRHFIHSSDKEECLQHLIKGNYQIGTLTVVYRMDVYNSIPKEWKKISPPLKMGDLPMFIEMSSICKFVYLPDITAKYRVLESSASHNSNLEVMVDFHRSHMNCARYYADKHKINVHALDKRFYAIVLRLCLKYENRDIAHKYFKEALSSGNLTVKSLIYYILLLIPFVSKVIKRLGY